MKRFTFKLTASLVSLFISMILCLLSNMSKYCLFFGLLFLSGASILFALYKNDDLQSRLNSLDEQLSLDDIDELTLYEIEAEKKRIKKEKKKLLTSFFSLALILIVVAFVVL